MTLVQKNAVASHAVMRVSRFALPRPAMGLPPLETRPLPSDRCSSTTPISADAINR